MRRASWMVRPTGRRCDTSRSTFPRRPARRPADPMMKRMVMLKAGDRIGEWLVERALGEGGMGAVYRVHSALSQRVVAALKVMKPTNEPDARARFVREAEALSALRHPAIVHVMGFSEDSVRGVPYIVMELAVGQTLKERL